jgi:hypothetical protein
MVEKAVVEEAARTGAPRRVPGAASVWSFEIVGVSVAS